MDKEIRYFEGYGVDCEGNIYNKNGSLKALHDNGRGYLATQFYYDGRLHCHTAHRVVALAWLGEPEDISWEVNHKNSDRKDNRVDNLEWVSKRDNRLHSYREGNRNVSGEKNANCKTTLTQAKKIFSLLSSEDNLTDRQIAEEVGVTIPIVRGIKYGKTWKHIKLNEE